MASQKLVNFGSSLQGPSVQELAKGPLVAVPQRYVQLDQEPPILPEFISMPKIPVIDMQSLLTKESMDLELERLHSVCKEWGFFQLTNHGVNSSTVEKLKSETEDFFNLPLEEKMRFMPRPGDVEGFGKSLVISEDQKLDWGDRETLESYLLETQKLAMTLLGMIGRAVNIDVEEIKEMFEDGFQSVRMNYYPPCPQPELVIGITPHSDATGITILLQANEVEGLQIRKEGMWIPVKPLPNSFVVNVGDILEIMSNGIYRSIEHRVAANSVKERLSIAMFFNPKLEGEFGPAPSLINPKNPALFKRVAVQKYYQDFFSRKLDGKSFLETMKIKYDEHNTN
ncbi:hypothetical protein HHK36_005053 [Tetracentron sinense]|uniref:Fe2OG dioxygenase domain-containing protein n=1 Tax=Tetracentron sinense TaxID=13715 RepID=A0A834ZUT4_TETSI|nr:hypothetical protein HHK36_005053 [Tetracentron sinense]